MILDKTNNTVERSEAFQETAIDIKKEGLAYIFSLMSDKLYTDKITAVLREYLANSLDSHAQNGLTEPVVLSLPTSLEPMLRIRDFGQGMSPLEIKDIFCSLGNSTKRQSNSYIGAFGVGSKAGFAYSDSFTITSFYQGTKNVYTVYKNEENLPHMALLSSTESDERNGIEFSIAVKERDIHDFQQKAYNTIKYFKVKPVIKNALIDFTFKMPECVLSGTDWNFHGNYSHSVVIMGGVGYKVNADSIYSDDSYVGGRKLLQEGIDIEVDIGSCDVAANRESLEYKEKTIKVIKDKLAQALESMGKIMEAKVASCTTLIDARKMVGFYNKHTVLRDIIYDNKVQLIWNGEVIKSSSVHFDGRGQIVRYSKYSSGRRHIKTSVRGYVVDQLDFMETNIIYIKDSNRIKERIKAVLTNEPDHTYIYLVDAGTGIGTTDFFTQTSFKPEECKKLSDIPVAKRIYAGGSCGKATDVYTTSSHEYVSSVTATNSKDCWELASTIDPNGVYITIASRLPNGAYSYEGFKSILSQLRILNIDIPEIYGVKQSGLKKFQATNKCISFTDWLNTAIATEPIFKELPFYSAEVEMLGKFRSDWNVDVDKKLGAKSLFGVFIKKYKEVSKHSDTYGSKVRAASTLGTVLGRKLFKTRASKLGIIFKKVQEKYGLLKHESDFPRYKQDWIDSIVNYAMILDNIKK